MAAGEIKATPGWIADFCPHPQMPKHIFLQNPLDAMSFYQLNANKIKLEESVFAAWEDTFHLIK